MAPNPNKYFARKVKVRHNQTIKDFSCILVCFRIFPFDTFCISIFRKRENGEKKKKKPQKKPESK